MKTVNIKPDLHERLKSAAINSGNSVASLVERAIEILLMSHEIPNCGNDLKKYDLKFLVSKFPVTRPTLIKYFKNMGVEDRSKMRPALYSHNEVVAMSDYYFGFKFKNNFTDPKTGKIFGINT